MAVNTAIFFMFWGVVTTAPAGHSRESAARLDAMTDTRLGSREFVHLGDALSREMEGAMAKTESVYEFRQACDNALPTFSRFPRPQRLASFCDEKG
jgi:hypothetical protein